MRKYVLSFALGLMSLVTYAQANYEKVMTEKISRLEDTRSPEDLQILANDFQRIAEKEKDKWQPNYYTALAYIQKGRSQMQNGNNAALEETADQAQKFVDAAESLEKNNSEIHLLQKMIYSLKMMVNPMERFRTFGAKAEEELKKAEQLDPSNPRVTLIKAEDVYYTPEQFGGSKTKGMELFKTALEKFNAFKPKTALDPNWGKMEAQYFLSGAAK
ncbi:hypothetical protein QE422_000455 [Chryseobacterium sp. SORGH_AS 447]|uniref:hypothetical protein n=1 Tax=Chryseobacterium sp. SORGH_AS_0447 TaxID=3041769 RepID=UPI002784E55D|nr:hypothetical protein [Chryseobacterium sp. SORGH_AS_0447]MDQ1160087.1 hypothetical protein [Chryseobacterium sp. SORGH_AS_0447]